MSADHLLPDFLAAFVPLQIAEYQRTGGPPRWEVDTAREQWLRMLDAGEGTELIFREKDKTARAASNLVRLIACLAFVPGGIKVFGHHFEAGRGNSGTVQAVDTRPIPPAPHQGGSAPTILSAYRTPFGRRIESAASDASDENV